ncbi:MAG: DUF1599 domain-containing protein [Bacteroidales bacterium]|jgi:hypothetical protein|nr:DUF1599 domain-containing protein [Bacteroidales bacterium]
MSSTDKDFDDIVGECKSLFINKMKDYGTAWRVLRLPSITDQIYIKARRIRSIEEHGEAKINEGVGEEYIGILNYAVMALIQLNLPAVSTLEDINLPAQAVLSLYEQKISEVKTLLLNKNHDYGEAWRSMRIASITDIILQKIFRIKSLEDKNGQTLVSEPLAAHYSDIINYSVFALIKLKENNHADLQ